MSISISVNTDKVLSAFDALSKQYPFAVAKALTDTAREVSSELSDVMEAELDKPTPFTKRGAYYLRATKSRLTSQVGIKDTQLKYLKWQIFGGKRSPVRKLIPLNTGAKVNKYGNLPRGYIKRMIDKSRGGSKGKVSYFYGKPKGTNRPVGIYQRTKKGGLVSLVAFNSKPFNNKQRFHFYDRVKALVNKRIDRKLKDAWEFANNTAR